MRYASTAIFFWLVLCISASILGIVVSCCAVSVESHMLNTTQSLLEGKQEEIYDATTGLTKFPKALPLHIYIYIYIFF